MFNEGGEELSFFLLNSCVRFFKIVMLLSATFHLLCKNTPLRLLKGFVVALEQEESQSHQSKLECVFLSNTNSGFLKLP